MCKRNSRDIKKKKRKKEEKRKKEKNEASMGCVRESPQIKMKPAWDV